jgi:cyclopropane fatty-acyl-phospholipid synthase-like methyltransferase
VREVNYMPSVFDKDSILEAKSIILTDEDTSTEERWIKETPYVAQRIMNYMALQSEDLIVDFGCGIGRVAKELIEKTGCSVLGVDISASMRSQAIEYVDDERFLAITPDMLIQMIKNGLKVDGVICIWVLQHIPFPDRQLNMLFQLLKDEGKVFIVNNHHAALPTNVGRVNEGTDIKVVMKEYFEEVFMNTLPTMVTTPKISENSFMAGYIKRKA